MIRFIAALDSKRGIADEHGIPWQGKLSADLRWFREHTLGQTVLMGRATYENIGKPLPDRRNVVATSTALNGVETVSDVPAFLQSNQDVWIIGGQQLFESTLAQANEIYLTRLEGDFGCTKFFPEYTGAFERAETSEPLTESGITYRFEIWRRISN